MTCIEILVLSFLITSCDVPEQSDEYHQHCLDVVEQPFTYCEGVDLTKEYHYLPHYLNMELLIPKYLSPHK